MNRVLVHCVKFSFSRKDSRRTSSDPGHARYRLTSLLANGVFRRDNTLVGSHFFISLKEANAGVVLAKKRRARGGIERHPVRSGVRGPCNYLPNI
jgi:hypothetical protein